MRLLAAALACALLAACASSAPHARAGGGSSTAGSRAPGATTQVSGCFRYSVTTDRTLYPAGTPVAVIVTAVNVSRSSCLGPPCGGITPWFAVTQGSQQVYRTLQVGAMCVARPRPRVQVPPGNSVTWYRSTWTPPGSVHGTFTVTWHWVQSVTVRSAPFRVG